MNKLWNASRFVRMNIDDDILNIDQIKIDQLEVEERWILNQLNKTTYEVNKCLDDFKFNEAAKIRIKTISFAIWMGICNN